MLQHLLQGKVFIVGKVNRFRNSARSSSWSILKAKSRPSRSTPNLAARLSSSFFMLTFGMCDDFYYRIYERNLCLSENSRLDAVSEIQRLFSSSSCSQLSSISPNSGIVPLRNERVPFIRPYYGKRPRACKQKRRTFWARTTEMLTYIFLPASGGGYI